MASRGMFIVLEGIDGCGKTTIAELLAKELTNVIVIKEPTTQTPAGKKIQAILRHKQTAPSPLEMQRLYIRDRAAHTKKIRAMLAKGKTVICQRYALSTYAYGTAFGVSQKNLKHDFLKPDITFLLDLPAPLAMKRIASRKQGKEYFEKQEKLAKIRLKYNKLSKEKLFGNVITVDAKPKASIILKKILWHMK